MNTIKLAHKTIGDGQPTFIVAEMSANHAKDYTKAVSIIEAAAACGADAIKLQTYTPDTITLKCDKEWFLIKGDENPDTWKNKTFYDLYEEAFTPWEWFPDLKKVAEGLGLVFFSTPFDHTAVDFLESLKVPLYKIASYEATDITLLKKVASTGKPIIMSVGFATLEEIEYSMSILKAEGVKDIVLLHCTTSYDSGARELHTNLRTIHDLKERFGVITGFSDNMGGIEVPVLAAAMGAAVIEKHFALEHDPDIVDDRFSLTKEEFALMVKTIRNNEVILGKPTYGPQTEAETYNRNFRRSLFAVKDIKKGEKISPENIRSVRPAYGLETRYYDEVIGKTASRDIEFGTPLEWSMVEK